MKLEGFDAPIFNQELDILQRQRLAVRIYDVVRDAPIEWSVRIGLFGKWGEGKTSVMKLVDNLATKHGDIVVWFNPWSVRSLDELWISFVDAIVESLQENDIEVEGLTKAKWKRIVSKHVTLAKSLSEANSLSKALVGGGASLIQKYLGVDGQTLKNIATKMGDKRILVFIDDLDRTDPSILPQLFLGLREILDLPRFSYVLGFDKEIVATALADYHSAWGSGHEFLDKIIDFPFTLPKLLDEQVLNLINSEVSNYADFIDINAIKKIEDLLPNSPRKLKNFIRRLSLLRKEVKRHDPDELDWVLICIVELIRQESDKFLEDMILNYFTGYNLNWHRLVSEKKEEKEKAQQELNGLLDQCKINDAVKRERLITLVMAWHKRSGINNSDIYQVKFISEPHAITWKEFRSLFEQWKNDSNIYLVNNFVETHANVREISPVIVATELYQTAISYRSTCLENASSSMLLDEQEKSMSSASYALDLIGSLYRSGLKSVGEKFFQSPENLLLIRGMAEHWIHFNSNEADRNARLAEKTLLLELVSLINTEHEKYFENLKPWVDSHFHEEERKTFRIELSSLLEEAVCEKAIELFNEKAGISWIGEYEVGDSFKYVLLRGESIIWQGDLREQLKSKLLECSFNSEIHKNAISYVELLIGTIQYGGNSVSDKEQAESILLCSEIVRMLWDSILARKVQFRFINHIFKIRSDLVGLGVSEDNLKVPEWMEEARAKVIEREKADN